jgi:hypothetical protein
MKISAIVKDEINTAKSVTGKKNINSPAIPGQKINGKNAANVVDVEAITGTAIFFADRIKTFVLLIPSFDLRFAYSTTIIAPSIRIPTERIKEKRTTTFIVTLKKLKIIIDIRNEKGIEALTRNEDFTPINEYIIIKTINEAKITLFSRSLTMDLIFSDSS